MNIEKIQKKQLEILNVLKDSNKPLSSSKIADSLTTQGTDISQRTVRLYLKQMDEYGLTKNFGKKGRLITDSGLEELRASNLLQRVGFLSAKIDQMTYGMDFDLASRTGTVVVNVTFVKASDLYECIDMVAKVFKLGFAMGQLATILAPCEQVGNITVPSDMVGFGTVCSITLNGVLLKYGIPTHSRFGGLLEIHNKKPTRFVDIINYDGSSIDPLEVFIRSGMTDYIGAISSGNGKIGASFREIPAQSRSLVLDLADKLAKIGLGGFMKIGHASHNLFDIPVNEGRSGAIVIGGLNPVSILEEKGIRVYSRALAGFFDYNKMFSYKELKDKVKTFL